MKPLLEPDCVSSVQEPCVPVKITLNGDPFEVAGPLTISALLVELDVDPRRVAIEHNLVVLKRSAYDQTTVAEGDQVEIVNFVGGGELAVLARPESVRMCRMLMRRHG